MSCVSQDRKNPTEAELCDYINELLDDYTAEAGKLVVSLTISFSDSVKYETGPHQKEGRSNSPGHGVAVLCKAEGMITCLKLWPSDDDPKGVRRFDLRLEDISSGKPH